MRRYVMTRQYGGTAVLVYDVGGTAVPYGLKHLVRHSPDGFEWGYGGSGPADLARSIVGDLLGDADPDPRKYQLVKTALVATLPKEGGEITEDQVLQVLRDYLEDQVLQVLRDYLDRASR